MNLTKILNGDRHKASLTEGLLKWHFSQSVILALFPCNCHAHKRLWLISECFSSFSRTACFNLMLILIYCTKSWALAFEHRLANNYWAWTSQNSLCRLYACLNWNFRFLFASLGPENLCLFLSAQSILTVVVLPAYFTLAAAFLQFDCTFPLCFPGR